MIKPDACHYKTTSWDATQQDISMVQAEFSSFFADCSCIHFCPCLARFNPKCTVACVCTDSAAGLTNVVNLTKFKAAKNPKYMEMTQVSAGVCKS